MPDRDRDALAARNRDTQLTVRVPAGLKPRVKAAAERGEAGNVSAFVVAAIKAELQRRDDGTTARARKPRTSAASPVAFVAAEDDQPQPERQERNASKPKCGHYVPAGTKCKICR